MSSRVRASALCLHKGRLLVVYLEDPVTKIIRPFPPGGKVEPGESPSEAAARETLEETGYSVLIEAASEKIVRYPFLWAGKVYDCTTHFYRAILQSQTSLPVADADYHRGIGWIPVATLETAFAFHETLQKEIGEIVRNRGR